MLHLLYPADDQGWPGVPVKAEPPELGQQPRAGGVPPVDRQLDRGASSVAADELLYPPDLMRRARHLVDRHAELSYPVRHLPG